ncbi:MAG: hypothetical protein ACRDBG_18330, partial [Waterburya sp.]
MRSLEDAVFKNIPGLDRSKVDTALSVSKSYFYLNALGFFNVPFTVVSVAQPIYTAPWHLKLSMKGIKHNPLKTTFDAIYGSAAINLANMGVKQVEKNLTPLQKEAFNYIKENHLIDMNPLDEIRDLGRPEILNKIEDVGGFNIKASEQIARTATFMSFVSHLDQAGMKDRSAMLRKADDLTNIVMADFNAGEKAMAFEKTGLIGNAAATLQTFKVNQLNQLYLLGKYAQQGGFASKQALPLYSLMATQLAMAGTLGFFAVESLDDLWEALKSVMPDDMFIQFKDTGIKKSMLSIAENLNTKNEGLGDATVFGIPSVATGINFSSRFDSGAIVETDLGKIFPFAGLIYDQTAAVVNAIDNSNAETIDAAMLKIVPASMRGLVETNSAMKVVERPDGTTLYSKAGDFSKGSYARTPEEERLRKFGFVSLPEAKVKENEFRS